MQKYTYSDLEYFLQSVLTQTIKFGHSRAVMDFQDEITRDVSFHALKTLSIAPRFENMWHNIVTVSEKL